MTGFKLSSFSGRIPKLGNRELPEVSATVANNVELSSGELRPLQRPVLVNRPNKPGPAESMFRAHDGIEAEAWFTWPFDVDIVRVPLSVDVESRFVWTGEGTTPKMATYSMAVEGGLTNYPASYYDLGIPAPQQAPSVEVTGGAAPVTSRFYVQTFMSQFGEESAPSPASLLVTGNVDGDWAITNLDAFPVNNGDCAGVFAAEVTTFTADTKHWLRAGEEVVLGDATVTVKGVTSPTVFTVAGDYSSVTTWARRGPLNIDGMKRRLYRTTGLAGAFQLVADDVGTSYTDSLADDEILGDELVSVGWSQPPVGLQGVCVHPSGSVVGFVGSEIWFSEPYQPHAFVSAWSKSTAHKIVGIGVYGQEIGVGTRGPLYVASGVEPATMVLDKKQGIYPCLSKRGLIAIGDGIVYPTSIGLIYAGLNGVNLLTDRFFDKDEWQNLNPSTMILAAAYGRIYVGYTLSAQDTRILTIDGDIITTSDVEYRELYADEAEAELYISDRDGIKQWDARNGLPLTQNYSCKEIVVAQPVNYGVAKIDYDPVVPPKVLTALEAARALIEANNTALLASGSFHGGYNAMRYNRRYINGSLVQQPPEIPSNNINFTLRANGRVVFSRTITSDKPFRLPSGYKADVYIIEVFSQSRIKEIRVAETADGLRQL